MIITVGGDAASGPVEDALSLAEAVGAEIAKRGCILLCGGRGGIMKAACRGAEAGGGTTVGVLPGFDKSQANAHVQIPIVTGLGEARNVVIALTADAVIAIDGEYGTLSEIAHALNNGKPVVGMGTWMLTKDGREAPIHRTEDPVDAVRWVIEAATVPNFSSQPPAGTPGINDKGVNNG